MTVRASNVGIDHRKFKDELYGEFARAGAAVASPKRLELLDLLALRPQNDRAQSYVSSRCGATISNLLDIA